MPDSIGRSRPKTNSSPRDEINQSWLAQGVALEEIEKENLESDLVYKLMGCGRTGEDIEAEFAQLTHEEIREKYAALLSSGYPTTSLRK